MLIRQLIKKLNKILNKHYGFSFKKSEREIDISKKLKTTQN